jgi:hypothetical protein
MYSITGKLVVKKEAEQVTERFKKREFVITDEASQYPQEILFQLTQDKVEMLDEFNEGDVLKVNFNLRGRRWKSPKTGETMFFNSLEAWRLEKSESETTGTELPPLPESEPAGLDDDSDDLPF